MQKFFILIFLFPTFLVNAQYKNEIDALLLFMNSKWVKVLNDNKIKGYYSTPMDNCSSIISVKIEENIETYKVNICDKKIIKI